MSPKVIAVCRADLLTGGLDLTIGHLHIATRASEALLVDLCGLNPLRAVGALFHDTTHAHSDVWILLHL
jgi:hypothetical protein